MHSSVTPQLRLAVSPLRHINVRDASVSGDGSWIVEGYAAVFEQDTVLYDGKWFRIREEIARGAFDTVIERVHDGTELVHLNHGHDMVSAVAATDVHGVGGLTLRIDDHGLKFTARVDAEDPDAVRMAAKMRRGVVAQASFAFTIKDQEIRTIDLEDGREEDMVRITEVGSLYDVCVCAQGAYSTTESSIRSAMFASLRVPDLGALGRSDPVSEGHEDRSPVEAEGPGTVAHPGGYANQARIALIHQALRRTDHMITKGNPK